MKKPDLIISFIGAFVVFASQCGLAQGTLGELSSSNAAPASSLSPAQRGGVKAAPSSAPKAGVSRPQSAGETSFQAPVEDGVANVLGVKRQGLSPLQMDWFSAFSSDYAPSPESPGAPSGFVNTTASPFAPAALNFNAASVSSGPDSAFQSAQPGATLSANPLDDAAAKASTKTQDQQDKVLAPAFANLLAGSAQIPAVISPRILPEPSAIALICLGAVAAAYAARRRAR